MVFTTQEKPVKKLIALSLSTFALFVGSARPAAAATSVCVVYLQSSELTVYCDGKTVKDISPSISYDLNAATQEMNDLLKQGYSVVGTATTQYLFQWTLQK